MKDYYEILEVNPKATEEIIKKVYRIKIKLNHPDLFQGEDKKNAEEKTKNLTEAYNVLIDKKKRMEYDALLKSNIPSNTEQMLINNLQYENQILKETLRRKEELIKDYLKTIEQISENQRLKYYPPENNYTNDQMSDYHITKLDLPLFFLKLVDFFIIIVAIILILLFLFNIMSTNSFRL